MKKLVLVLAAVLAPSFAFADQCQVVTHAQALKAIKILNSANQVQKLCEPCGESLPQEVRPYSVDLQTFNGLHSGQYSVAINGAAIDLAYTYVNGMNLAMLVGCKAQGVSDTLQR
jgi:hypothetical protein